MMQQHPTLSKLLAAVVAMSSVAFMSFLGFWRGRPAPPQLVLDADAACIICEGLEGEDPAMARVFARGSLATARAFGISVTAKEGAEKRVATFETANNGLERQHNLTETELREEIEHLNGQIRASADQTKRTIERNNKEAAKYRRAHAVFFN